MRRSDMGDYPWLTGRHEPHEPRERLGVPTGQGFVAPPVTATPRPEMVMCPDCGGTGDDYRKDECPTCYGEGTVRKETN